MAKEYYVVPSTISQLIKKVKKSPKVLAELLSKYEEKEALRKETGKGIMGMLNKNECLSSVAAVSENFIKSTGLVVKPRLVQMVMREDLHMSYRPIQQLSM